MTDEIDKIDRLIDQILGQLDQKYHEPCIRPVGGKIQKKAGNCHRLTAGSSTSGDRIGGMKTTMRCNIGEVYRDMNLDTVFS